MSEKTEQYKQAWEKFQEKMIQLRKRKAEIFKNISQKIDQQKIEALMKKIKGDV